MLIYDNNTLKNEEKNNYIALGSFDGLHLGHLSLIEKVKGLAKENNGKAIVVGFNFKFGYKNLGNVELLEKLQEKYNYKLYVMEPCMINDEVISSTLIRNELLQGNVNKVFNMLSRPFMLCGKVVDGKKLG